MKNTEPVKVDAEKMNEIEDALFQYVVDIYEGDLGIEEARRLGGPSQEALARWTEKLDELERQSKEQKRRRTWRRIIIAAAVIAALLLMSALAYTAHYWGLFLNVQEEFTQPRTDPGPEGRFSIFYYSAESSVQIDSEDAETSYQLELDNLTAHVLEKAGLTTLYWNVGSTIVSIEFHPEDISLDEIKALAASMTTPT